MSEYKVEIFVYGLTVDFGKDDQHSFSFNSIPDAIDWLIENKDSKNPKEQSLSMFTLKDHYKSVIREQMKAQGLGDFNEKTHLPKATTDYFKIDGTIFEMKITDLEMQKQIYDNMENKIKSNITNIKPLSLSDVETRTPVGVNNNIPYHYLESDEKYWFDTVKVPTEAGYPNGIATFGKAGDGSKIPGINVDSPTNEYAVKPALYVKMAFTPEERAVFKAGQKIEVNGLPFKYLGGIPYKEGDMSSHREIFIYDDYIRDERNNVKHLPFAKEGSEMLAEINKIRKDTDKSATICVCDVNVSILHSDFKVLTSPVQQAIRDWAKENDFIIQKTLNNRRNDQPQKEFTYEESNKKDDWQLGE